MSKKKIIPLEDRVLVKIIEENQTVTESGIVLPPNVEKEKPIMGEVVAVGDSEMIKVKKGERILFAKFSGTEIKLDGQEYLILQANDILAKIKD